MATRLPATSAVAEPPDVGFSLATGTYEDAVAMIGETLRATSPVEVNWPMIQLFCAMTEDANPSYWDPAFAEATWGGIVSPPGMLLTWLLPRAWTPSGPEELPLIAARVPLPGDTIINVSTETELPRPMLVGDRLSSSDEVTAVSPLKRTRLGEGHFVTSVLTVTNQHDQVVARVTNVAFRFRSEAA